MLLRDEWLPPAGRQTADTFFMQGRPERAASDRSIKAGSQSLSDADKEPEVRQRPGSVLLDPGRPGPGPAATKSQQGAVSRHQVAALPPIIASTEPLSGQVGWSGTTRGSS